MLNRSSRRQVANRELRLEAAIAKHGVRNEQSLLFSNRHQSLRCVFCRQLQLVTTGIEDDEFDSIAGVI
jgi:hypothetical protein